MRLKPPNESADEALRLIHELQIHQVELEVQNEELAQTRSRLEQSLKKYDDLYDFSPVGYFMLSSDGAGTILEVNLTGATLLGVERSDLLQRRMGIFLSVESRTLFNAFLDTVLAGTSKASCEIVTERAHRLLLLEGIATEYDTGRQCSIAVVDITAHKTTTDTLRRKERYQRALLNNFPFLIWLKDTDSRFLAVNQAFAQACGAGDADEVTGKTDFDIWPHDLAAAYRADDRAVLASRQQKNVEEAVDDQGSRQWFETYKAPVSDEHGELFGTVGFARNITDRKQIETALQDSEAFNSSVLDSLVEHIAVLDTHGVILLVNEAWRRFAQENGAADHQTFVGSNYLGVCAVAPNHAHGEEAAVTLTNIRAVLAGTLDAFHLEYPCHSPTEQRWFHLHVTPLRGTRPGAVVAHENITQSKLAEFHLRIAATAFETQEGMFVTDAQQTILRINRAFTTITGYSAADAVGQTPRLFRSGRHNAAFYAAMWATLRQTGQWQGEIWNRRKNGEEFPEWLTITAVKGENGADSHYVAMLFDITERKRAEAAQETLHQQLLAASRRAGMAEVAVGVLHNLGNAFNSVNVSVSLMADRLRQSRTTGLHKVIRLLRESLAGALNAPLGDAGKIPRLLDYLEQWVQHQVSDQRHELDELQKLGNHIDHIKLIISQQQHYAVIRNIEETIALNEIVDDALNLTVASCHAISLVRDYEPLPLLRADKHKLLQILANLLQNAQQALKQGEQKPGMLAVRTRLIDARRVSIEVTDNGMGIAAENITRIFSFGFTTKTDGHGFGLHFSANLAKEMGGQLTCRSPGLGQGATFVLDLPFSKG